MVAGGRVVPFAAPDLGSSAADDLRSFLASTRTHGYTVERMAPPLVQAAEVMIGLHRQPVSPSMRAAIGSLLAEITAAGLLLGAGTNGREPVTSIAAPMFDASGAVTP